MSDKAPDLLMRASELLADRGREYEVDGGERSMDKCVVAFNAITGIGITPAEGWLLFQLMKDVRQWTAPGYHKDSGEDGIAYSALKVEALSNEHST